MQNNIKGKTLKKLKGFTLVQGYILNGNHL